MQFHNTFRQVFACRNLPVTPVTTPRTTQRISEYALMYISFPPHHHCELSCDIIVDDRVYDGCVREVGGTEAVYFIAYDVTRAKLSRAKCPLPSEICMIFHSFRLTIIEVHAIRAAA